MSTTSKRILFVLTNHDSLGEKGDMNARRTGFHLAEAAEPWQVLSQAGYDIDFASPAGGLAPIDPTSLDVNDATNRAFLDDKAVAHAIENTTPIAKVNLDRYAGIYFPGGHGTMWDLPDNSQVQEAVRKMYEADNVVAAVCHGPAALVNVKLSTGTWLVDGKNVSAFTDEEEKAVDKADDVPFLLAAKLKERGAKHEKADNFQTSVSVDGNLVTGQNPASAQGVGEAIRDTLQMRRDKAA